MKVFVCNCRGEIAVPGDLDFGEGVTVEEHSHLCSEEGMKLLRENVGQEGERPVIAGCSPRVAEKFFGSFSPEIVNIREQAALVGHNGEKVKALIRGAVEKARASRAIPEKRFDIRSKSALVIGGGVAGLEAARQIAGFGFKVHLVEKSPFLGGMVAKLDRLYPEGTPNSHTLYPLIDACLENDKVEILTDAEVTEVRGVLGDYRVKVRHRKAMKDFTLSKRCEDICPVTVQDEGVERKAIYYVPTHPDGYAIDWENCTLCGKCAEVCDGIDLSREPDEVELAVGSIVVATGLRYYDARRITEYGYGRYEGVYTPLEFERKAAAGLIEPKTVVIINCAGSRDRNHLPYCSKVCCLIGMKEAKLAKDRFPDAEVYVTYIDLRSYGQFEDFYETLRERSGVNFIKGRPGEVARRNGKLVVRTECIDVGEDVEIEADAVVLSCGFVPDTELLTRLGIRTGGEFPIEYVNSSLSCDSNPRGIFIAGSSAFPQSVGESVGSARAAAGGVVGLLSKDSVRAKTPTAEIDSDVCGRLNCRICVNVCPYAAVSETEVDGEMVIKVDESICMGCGICTAACGSGANQLQGCTDRELLAQVRGTIGEGDICAFLCKWSAYNAADKAGYERLEYPENARIIRVPCTGRVDSQLVFEALSRGARGVLIAGCYPDSCHYVSGNFKARTRHALSKEILKGLGINTSRVRVEWIGKDESRKLVNVMSEMMEA